MDMDIILDTRIGNPPVRLFKQISEQLATFDSNINNTNFSLKAMYWSQNVCFVHVY